MASQLAFSRFVRGRRSCGDRSLEVSDLLTQIAGPSDSSGRAVAAGCTFARALALAHSGADRAATRRAAFCFGPGDTQANGANAVGEAIPRRHQESDSGLASRLLARLKSPDQRWQTLARCFSFKPLALFSASESEGMTIRGVS